MEQLVTRTLFGTTASGEEVTLFRIPNNTNDYIEISNYGCTICKICVHNPAGKMQNILCGYETLAEYEASELSLGAVLCNAKTAHKVWDIQEVGNNYVFFSCAVPAEETEVGCALAIGARIMWVNLNRIVIDLFVTPEDSADVNLAYNLPFRLKESGDLTGYLLRTFCREVLVNGQHTPVTNTPYADIVFWPQGTEPRTFLDMSEDSKPMAELANPEAGMTISAYSNLNSLTCDVQEGVKGIRLNQTMETPVHLEAGQTLTGRIIYGFDRFYTEEEVISPEPNPFSAFI